MLEIRHFLEDPEKCPVASHMISVLKVYFTGACECGELNTGIQMSPFSATLLKASHFKKTLYWNIFTVCWKVRITFAQKGSKKKCLVALMDFMLLDQNFVLLFAFLALQGLCINCLNFSVIYTVNNK